MRPSPSGLFEVLDPPPGGWVELTQRIEQEKRQTRVATIGGAGLAMAIAVLISWVLWSRPPPQVDTVEVDFSQDPAFMAWLGATQSPPVTIAPSNRHRLAVQPVVVTPEVVFYRIGGTSKHETVLSSAPLPAL